MRRPARIERTVPLPTKQPNPKRKYAHRQFIRDLPCLVCGKAAPSECAHVRQRTDGGMGMKPDDRYTLPLCHAHHSEQHVTGETTFWGRVGIDPLDYAYRLYAVSGDHTAGLRVVLRARQKQDMMRP
jgi:hypothetical protein